MKTIVFSLLLPAIVALGGGIPLRAADPPPALPKGKVLILKNEYTIEGGIERVGDRYRIRRKAGETWVPVERALCLAASLPDAYAYLRGRINLDDADERLRLARWCHNNGLSQQALAELQAAANLRPEHAETRRLLHFWKQAAVMAAKKPAVPPPAPPAVNDLPPVEVTTETLGSFATRVQPILMNTCARCHATGRGGSFHLRQVYEASIGNRRTLEQNLAAVLAEVDLNQPEASRLLTKSISDHAHTGQAPLRSRQTAPYRTLENWIKETVANNPHLRDSLPASASVPAAVPPAPLPPPVERPAQATQWGADTHPTDAPTPPAPLPSSPVSVPVSPNGTAVPDPYDPEPFNRKMHPQTNNPGPGK